MPRKVRMLIILLFTAQNLTAQIDTTYHDTANRIIESALADSFAFGRLAEIVDTFGPRFSGSKALEDAIDWVLAQMAADSLENVHGEEVMIPRWVRGEESAEILVPRSQTLGFIGLGRSVGTPRKGLVAEALVVNSFVDLQSRADEARGKIVVYNVPFTNYMETVTYRGSGANEAAKVGAVASLVRSVTPHAMAVPHAGALRYADGIKRIPSGAITIEDALLLQRYQDRGEEIVLRLRMAAHFQSDVPSRNIVAELTGSETPEEVVVMGGHIDSWDVGQGALDDAGGCVAAWEALLVLKRLGLRPRRTIRVVLWTNEEIGLKGGRAYRDAHADELDNHVLAIETDSGVFKPEGFGFQGTPESLVILQEIAALLVPIGADSISAGHGGADISPLIKEGVPGMGLRVDGEKYFWYHHTAADTFDKLDPDELNRCVAALAVMAYVVADMPDRLPR
ncbi:M28 family metallopeptidase [Candidatus Neomarinimicrobiota bacterium]